MNILPFFSLLLAALPLDPSEPQNYQEFVSFDNPDRAKLIEAMKIEMKSLLENKTWGLIQPPLAVKTISAKRVFKLKRRKNGEITRFKARWFVKRYSQTLDIDYNKTFASVVKS